MPFIVPLLPAIIGAAGAIGGGLAARPSGSSGSQQPGGLAGAVGGIDQQNQQQWQQAAAINMLNYARDSGQISLDRYNQLIGPLMAGLQQNQGSANIYLWGGGDNGVGQIPQFGGAMQDWQGGILDLFRNLGEYTTPQMQQAYQGLFGLNEGAANTGNLAGQVFAGGGWSPFGQQVLDRAMEMGQGQGWQLGQLATTGGELLGRYGVNGMTGGAQDAALAALAGQGRTPGINNLSAAGQNALGGSFGVGGLTPTGAVGEGVGLQQLLEGGRTPQTQELANFGTQQAAQEPLLPMDEALNFARQEAAQNVAGQREGAMRQILARGGGPAALSQGGMGGTQAQGVAEFADYALEAESQAIRDALMKQQGLQLQRQEQGTGMALNALDQERARQAVSASMLGNLEDVASRRFLAGGGMMSDAERVAAQRELGLGGLGVNAGELENQRMQTGGSLMDIYNRYRLGGLSLGQQGLQAMNQYALGAGGLQNSMIGTQGQNYNNILQNILQGGQLGANRGTAISNATNQGFGNQNQFYGNLLQALAATYNPQTSMANQALSVFGNLASFNPFSPYGSAQAGQASPWASILSGVGQVAQAGAAAIGHPNISGIQTGPPAYFPFPGGVPPML